MFLTLHMNEQNFADHIQKWINKNEKSNKSKTAFKTHFVILSKLAEQAKIHLVYMFKRSNIYCEKFYLENNFFSKSRDLTPL